MSVVTQRKYLPQEIADCLTVLEMSEVSVTITNDDQHSRLQKLYQALGKIVSSDKPRTTLNRSMVGLARDKQTFKVLVNWLNTPQTKKLFESIGFANAWKSLLKAFKAIDIGETPHKAFGMDKKNGRPTSWNFNVADKAAAYAQYLLLAPSNNFNNWDSAVAEASVVFGVPTSEIKNTKLPKLTLDEAKELSQSEYEKKMDS